MWKISERGLIGCKALVWKHWNLPWSFRMKIRRRSCDIGLERAYFKLTWVVPPI